MGQTMSRKIYQACLKGDYEKVRDCLEDPKTNKKELLSQQFTFEYKRTLLHTAALNGHGNIVELLLLHGADVNCKTRYAGDYTALHLAVDGKNLECVKVLLQNEKIDVTAKDGISKKTAYQHAIDLYPKDSPIPVLLKSAEVVQAAKASSDKDLTEILQGIDKLKISDDCLSQALLAALSKQRPNVDIIKTILMYTSKSHSMCNSLDLISCISQHFNSKSVNVKLAGLLLLCWTARNNQSKELEYFLGAVTVQWSDLESVDDMLNNLIKGFPNLIQTIRDEIKRLKCIDIAPAITMAITCNCTGTAKLLLTHGSLPLNENMYHIDWRNLQVSSLPPDVLKGMYHRRQFSGIGLEWNQVTHIDLRNNYLTEVPHMIFKLPLLTTLYLNRNKLKSLPDVKKVSASLNHLYLSNNMLKDLPKAYALCNLRTLKLDNNHFEHIPECVSGMVALETLDISENMITVLPLELGRLTKLTTFEFDKKRISLPQDWASNCSSKQELIQWLRSLLLKARPFKTIKLLVIGWQGKGKTTLVHRLRDDFEYNRDISERTMTKGVEVSEMGLQKVVAGFVPSGSRITFQVWDFAGQKDFHLMHMCFLPSIGLYILVWNLMDGEQGIQKMKDWLDNITCHETTKATVIIVGSHLDCIKAKFNNKHNITKYIEDMRGQINTMSSDYREKHVHIVDVVEVSCNAAASCGIKDLKQKILEACRDIIRGNDVRVLDEPVPTFYHEMVKNVQSLRSTMYEDKTVPIVNRDRMEALMREISGHKDIVPAEFEEVVSFLKDRGIILHFNDRDLRDLYFIDPRWLFSLMSQVICTDTNDDGLVLNDQLFSDVQEICFTEHSRQQGIRLLSRFQLVHCLDSEHLLVPSRFPESPPQGSSKGVTVDTIPSLRRLYQMDPVPPGLFSRLIARLLHYLESMICEAFRDHQKILSSSTKVATKSTSKTPFPSQSSPQLTPTTTTELSKSMTSLSSSKTTTATLSKSTTLTSQLTTTTTTETTTTVTAATFLPQSSLSLTSTTPTADSSSVSFSTSSKSFLSSTTTSTLSLTTKQPMSSSSLSVCPAELSSSWLPGTLHRTLECKSQEWSVSNLKKCNKLQWWRDGLQLNLTDLLVVVELVEEDKIQIRTDTTGPGRQMMILIDEHIDTLIGEWYNGIRVTKCLPCVECDRLNHETKHIFTMNDCLEKMEQSNNFLVCPFHEKQVGVHEIAPDICLNDIHHQLLFEDQHLHYDENSFIKKGSFGKVYRAVLSKPDGPRAVAVKQFIGDQLSSFKELRKEIKILRRINHPNLVQMIGVARNLRCIALEIAQYGSLDDILFDMPRRDIPRLVLVAISREVAVALDELHKLNIVHRDLTPGNVLVFSLEEKDRLHVKVTDFGTANFVGPSGMRESVGRTHIRAPEVLQLTFKEDYGIQVDIYSFAILLYSLISRRRAFDQLSSMKVRTRVLEHKRPAWRNVSEAMSTFINLTRLMCAAWHQEPRERPTAQQCYLQLQKPGFQLLMSKLAFKSSSTIYMVYLISVKKGLLIVHRTSGHTYVSVFSGKFTTKQSKHDYLVSMTDDVVVEACASTETVVVLVRESLSCGSGIFKIFSMLDDVSQTTVKFDGIPAAINGMAVSFNTVFVASEDGCFAAHLNELGTSSTMHRLTDFPSKSIELSTDRLWLSCESQVIMYSIGKDYELCDRTSIDIPGITSMRYHSNAVWAINNIGLINLNQHQSVIVKNNLLSSFVLTNDAIWLGLNTGDITIISLSSRQVIATFQAHSGPVQELLYCPDNDPPIVISCGKENKRSLGRDDVIFPMSVDSSETVKLTGRKLPRRSRSRGNDFDSNWETVDDIGDVLLAWQALSWQSWNLIRE